MKEILHIYTRVSSTIQQEDGTSLDSQKYLGIKRAEELGFEARLWNEGGQSSFFDDLKNRPVLVSLLTLIESGSVRHLFVYNTDRLSRNQQTWAVIRYKLLTHGVTLHTASGQMKLKNPVDDLMLGILSEISQYDNRIRSERSRLGRFHKVQQGYWKGGPPPFGYRLINRKLETDPFESTWVKRMYDWYCHGVSIKAIQTRLNRDGVMTRRGNTQWSLGSIQLILRNSVYVGYFDYTDNMLKETVRIPSPQIIDPHLFQIAQDKRTKSSQRRMENQTTKHFYLLRGLLTCGHCGSLMGGRINKAGHQNVYYCVNKERGWKTRGEDHPKWKRGSTCSMTRSINIDRTNQVVWDLVKGILQRIRERTQKIGEDFDQTDLDLGEEDQSPADEFSWMTEEQLEQLSEVDRRTILQQIITSIAVSLNASSQQHTLVVTFDEKYRGWLAARSETQITSETTGKTTSDPSEDLGEARVTTQGDMIGESAAGLLANPGNLDQLSNHGGVTRRGPLSCLTS